MTVEELIAELREMPPDAKVRASVDVSTSQADGERRAFCEQMEGVFLDGPEVTLVFIGELNDEKTP